MFFEWKHDDKLQAFNLKLWINENIKKKSFGGIFAMQVWKQSKDLQT